MTAEDLPIPMRQRLATGQLLLPGALLAVFGLALGLRLWNLGKESLWFDEALSVQIASLPRKDIGIDVRIREQIPPLYHYILHYWIERIGTTEFIVRFPSVLFGLGAMVVIYHLGRELFGVWEGVIAALLLGCSGFNIYYAQEARAYTLLLFTALLSCYAFVQLVREGGGRNQVGFVIATALMLWSHLHSVFIVLAQQMIWVVVWWQNRKGASKTVTFDRWINLNTAAVVLFFPWIPTVLIWMRKVSGSFWIPKMTGTFVPWVYSVYAGNWVLLGLIVVLGIWAVWKTAPKWTVLFAVLLALLPVLVPCIVSYLVRPLFVPRYGIVTTAGLALVAARGIMALPRLPVRLGAVGVCAALSLLAIPRVFANLDPKSDARGAVQFLIANVKRDDVILLNAGFNEIVYRYYAQDTALEPMQTYSASSYVPHVEHTPETRLWVWTETSPYGNSNPRPLSDIEEQGWKLISSKSFAGRLSIQQFVPTRVKS